MDHLTFANPKYLYFILFLLPIIGWYIWKQKNINATLQISSLQGFEKAPKSYKYYIRHLLFILRIFALILLIIVLARPQSTSSWENSTTEGIDIVLALDISSSMLAQDFDPNRIEAAKKLASMFISGRPYDRIGLVVFSGQSFTQCPLTTDHSVVINQLKDLKSGMIEDGTAIGLGLATAINRLKESKAKSKVIILLTDGVNNMGEIDPLTAGEIAQTFGIKVYAIGVGTYGMAPYPFQTPFGIQYQQIKVEIDEEILNGIASKTNGKYFRANNNQKLKMVYEEIDKLEKSKIETKEYSRKKEEFLYFAMIACLLLLVEVLMRYTILRSIP